MSTAVEETNIEMILAVMNTTELVVEIKPGKNSGPFIYPQVPSFILNSCTLNAPTPICLADTSYKSERAE